jgi:hypothetical protein
LQNCGLLADLFLEDSIWLLPVWLAALVLRRLLPGASSTFGTFGASQTWAFQTSLRRGGLSRLRYADLGFPEFVLRTLLSRLRYADLGFPDFALQTLLCQT